MKKNIVILLFVLFGVTAYSQGFGGAISAGYLSELDGAGGSADLIYEFNEKWGVSTDFTFAASETKAVRNKWTILNLNARYKVYDEFYFLGGGQWLNVTLKGKGLSDGNPLGEEFETSEDGVGFNVGAGYKYNLADNVNIFADVKYVGIDVGELSGYVHARLGLHFDF